jgi:hypothetical protein
VKRTCVFSVAWGFRNVDAPVKAANQALVRSIPKTFKQSLKVGDQASEGALSRASRIRGFHLQEHLAPVGFRGFKFADLTPNKTRRAQVRCDLSTGTACLRPLAPRPPVLLISFLSAPVKATLIRSVTRCSLTCKRFTGVQLACLLQAESLGGHSRGASSTKGRGDPGNSGRGDVRGAFLEDGVLKMSCFWSEPSSLISSGGGIGVIVVLLLAQSLCK